MTNIINRGPQQSSATTPQFHSSTTVDEKRMGCFCADGKKELIVRYKVAWTAAVAFYKGPLFFFADEHLSLSFAPNCTCRICLICILCLLHLPLRVVTHFEYGIAVVS